VYKKIVLPEMYNLLVSFKYCSEMKKLNTVKYERSYKKHYTYHLY